MKKRWMSERSLFEGHSIQLIFKRISWNSGKTADQRPIPWMGGLQRACSRSDLVCKSLKVIAMLLCVWALWLQFESNYLIDFSGWRCHQFIGWRKFNEKFSLKRRNFNGFESDPQLVSSDGFQGRSTLSGSRSLGSHRGSLLNDAGSEQITSWSLAVLASDHQLWLIIMRQVPAR